MKTEMRVTSGSLVEAAHKTRVDMKRSISSESTCKMTGERFCGEMRNLSGVGGKSPLGKTDYSGACKSTFFGDYKQGQWALLRGRFRRSGIRVRPQPAKCEPSFFSAYTPWRLAGEARQPSQLIFVNSWGLARSTRQLGVRFGVQSEVGFAGLPIVTECTQSRDWLTKRVSLLV